MTRLQGRIWIIAMFVGVLPCGVAPGQSYNVDSFKDKLKASSQVPPSAVFQGQPAFSPDGRYLAVFMRGTGPTARFGLLWPATLNWVKTPEPPGALGWDSHMVWSPSGDRLLFAAAQDSAFADLWVYDAGRNVFERATGASGSPGLWGRPKWSPKGDAILAAKQNGVEWAILTTGGVQTLTDMGLPPGAIADVAWGPSAGTLWVAVKSTPRAADSKDEPDGGVYLYTMSKDMLEKRFALDGIESITPSPNGRLLACAATGGVGGIGATGGVRLLIVNPNGDLVASLADSEGNLTWSTDSNELVYSTQRTLNVFDAKAMRFRSLTGAAGGADAVFLHPQTDRLWLAIGDSLYEVIDGRREFRFKLNDKGRHKLTVRDLNDDGRIDTLDYLIFERCFNGPGRPPRKGCPEGVDVDYDEDGDVDMADYAIFKEGIPEISINGRGVPLEDRYVK